MSDRALAETRAWVELAVIGLNLCPFARAPQTKGQLRYALSEAGDPEALLQDLVAELKLLAATPAEETETTLLVHPHVLGDFADYNDFLDVAEAAVAELGLEGMIQVASFHPRYRFAGSDEDDVTNATNRSPGRRCTCCARKAWSARSPRSRKRRRSTRRTSTAMRRLGASGWDDLQRRIRAEA
jgi:hypothetical protein